METHLYCRHARQADSIYAQIYGILDIVTEHDVTCAMALTMFPQPQRHILAQFYQQK